MAFLSEEQIAERGFKSVGKDVKISDKASIYNCGAIEIGDHSRLDDFCVISPGAGGLVIGRYVHIAVYCALIGKERIEIQDFAGLSSRVSIYSSNDDYSGGAMTNPCVPAQYTNVTSGAVLLERHAIVGSGTVILPGVTLHEGSGVGAMSLVKKDCKAFGMYFGTPARQIGDRIRTMLEIEKQLMAN